jgi:hypothetical protein
MKVGDPGFSGNFAGAPPIRGLFKENHEGTDKYDHVEPIYSLADFRNIFLEEMDFTEYKAAIRCVGSWEKWEDLKTRWPGFNRYIDNWKEELEQILKGRAFHKMIELLDCGTKGTELAAARFLVRAEWVRSLAEEKEEKQARQDRKTEELLKKSVGTQEEWQRVNDVISIPEQDKN